MAATRKLSPAQLDALAWSYAFNKRKLTVGMGYSCPVARSTLKSLATLGIVRLSGATEWRHGVGNVLQYRITDDGLALVIVGRLIAALAGTLHHAHTRGALVPAKRAA